MPGMRLNRCSSTAAGRGPAMAGLIAAALLAALAGCLFSTREPEDSPDTGQIQFDTPTEPRLVLDNVRRTFAARSITNYDRSIFREFEFRPDPSDDIPDGFFDAWGRVEEIDGMAAVLSSEGTVTFTWTPAGDPIAVPDGDPDDRFYEGLAYQMRFTKAGKIVTMSGRCDLYMRYVDGLYEIYRWDDIMDGSGNETLGMRRWKGPVLWE